MEVSVEEKHLKRKKWIKRFAIIFFTIMLVLTFFSNTIMNYSLPQVSTQEVTSDTVSAKVRGTGTIESADSKEVTINESREVTEVLVHEGDMVKKGDVILKLKDGESIELETAEENLRTLEEAYQNKILLEEIDDRLVTAGENGGYSYDATRAKLKVLSQNVKTIQERVVSLQNQVDSMNLTQSQGNGVSDDMMDEPMDEPIVNPELERLSRELETAKSDLEKATKEHEDYIAEINTVNDIKSQNEAIVKAREELEKLRNNALGNEVTAPVDGTIEAISVKAGDTTLPEVVLATIHDGNNGYSLSFSVTNEQAKKVKVGDVATISNSWYYGDVTVTLKSIKNDPSMPAKQKILTCGISGEVTVGDTMTVSLGEKSGSYEYVVPNSAIREDNNGKFILIVRQKSSPLGNRYVARRINVEVLASDDSKSAVKGALEGGEYVITTSNKMINPGDLIRLAD